MTIDFTKTLEEASDFLIAFNKNEQCYNEDDFEEKIGKIATVLAILSACYVHQGVCKDLITRREAFRYIVRIGKKYIEDAKDHFKVIEFSAGIEEVRRNREERYRLLPNLDS